MADAKSGILHVAFRYEGHQYRKSLEIRNQRKAKEHAKAVQSVVNALKNARDPDGPRLIRRCRPNKSKG